MTTSSVTSQKAVLRMPAEASHDSAKPEVSSATDKPGHEAKPRQIIAGYLSPNCEHDWLKLANDLQTLESEGKTIWRCRTCAEITNTYSWQTP